MNIDAIIAKIGEEAQQTAAQTLANAKEKVAAQKAELDAGLAAAREKALATAQQEATALRDRLLRMAALDQRKETLAMKRAVIDQAFDAALAKLRGMSKAQAADFHIRLLQETARGDEALIIAPEDAAQFDAAFFTRANEAMSKAGKLNKLRLADERRPLAGGFVLEQGGMEIDCTYASVLRTQRAGLEAEVAAVLFG